MILESSNSSNYGRNAWTLPWYIAAASQGHNKAQLSLALILLVGRSGLEVDDSLSWFWLRIAESKGPVVDGNIYHPKGWNSCDPVSTGPKLRCE
jgi:TPR repeat protein